MSTENKGGGGRGTLSAFCPLCSPSLLFPLRSACYVTYALKLYLYALFILNQGTYIVVSRSCDTITSEWDVSLSKGTHAKHMMLKVWLDLLMYELLNAMVAVEARRIVIQVRSST